MATYLEWAVVVEEEDENGESQSLVELCVCRWWWSL
jgi:hypothetical protein